MKALFLNCTLKKTPETSNTEFLINEAIVELKKLGVECETVRPVDYNIVLGTNTKADETDQWPIILEKIKESEILVMATPIWLGFPGSVSQIVIEKLDAMFHESELLDPQTGQFPLYNKVAGVIITGNEDGAQLSIARIQMALNEFGCTIPPNAISYWVGEAGGSTDYGEVAGRKEYTNKNTFYMVYNLWNMAMLLAKNPIKLNLNELSKMAKDQTIND